MNCKQDSLAVQRHGLRVSCEIAMFGHGIWPLANVSNFLSWQSGVTPIIRFVSSKMKQIKIQSHILPKTQIIVVGTILLCLLFQVLVNI